MSPDARPVYCVNDARQIELGAAHSLCLLLFPLRHCMDQKTERQLAAAKGETPESRGHDGPVERFAGALRFRPTSSSSSSS